ncbi:TRAP transporter small permease [Paracoccus alkenifer]|uniref:TRAP transporter small permease protein n=1 Tax=Paracoccus alkenifer TaxID=65735 RepID=A0A1H6NQF2_9RHOB|nr:TRAP transporter small permease subunit [Paracoccus alkenifer]SEI13128.1 Tripartite ATP-independent transporter, DctQ component [Paracoccus alkenifer]
MPDITARAGQIAGDAGSAGLRLWRRAGTILRGSALIAATAGGVIFFGLATMLTISIVARKTMGWQVRGDVEIVQMAGAVAASLLFGWCQTRYGNVAVDFATKSLPRGIQQALTRIGHFSLGCLGLLLAARSAALALGSIRSHAISTLLAWPEGYWQLAMAPGLVLFGIIGLFQSVAPLSVTDEMAFASTSWRV